MSISKQKVKNWKTKKKNQWSGNLLEAKLRAWISSQTEQGCW